LAALSVAVSEPEASPSVDEDLAEEGGEGLPEIAVEAPSELADAVQAVLLDPVQSPEQMGRLPEELTLEAEAPVVGTGETVQVVEVQAAEQFAAEPVAEAVTGTTPAPAGEAAEPVAAVELEPAEVVQDVVETFTESLIVTSTTTDTSEMPVAAQESETPAVLEADAVAVAEVPAAADPEPEAPTETVEPVLASLEIVAEAGSEPVTAAVIELEAPNEIVEPVTASVDIIAEANSEPAAAA
jgi:hypothetical protein